MTAPRTLNSSDSLKLLRVLQMAMLASILLYALLVWRIPAQLHPQGSTIYFAITVVAILSLAVLFVLRKLFALRTAIQLSNTRDDAAALGPWRAGYIISYAVSEAIALYGLVLHFLGFSAKQVAPFFIAGFLLILFLAPSLPQPGDCDGQIQRP